MYALAILACADPLVPGEAVLGVETPASFTYGGPGDRLGSAVAGRGAVWLASAPGADQTWRSGAAVDSPSVWVGFWGESEVFVDAGGQVSVAGEARWSVPGAIAWAAGPTGIVAATATELRFVDRAESAPIAGLEAVALGEARVLGRVCDADGCEGRAWTLDGVALGAYALAGEGGAVGEWDGLAWAGAPDWAAPEGTGAVCAEDGTCLVGMPGDHLGAAIGGGYATGTFNKWIVPPRARLIPLAGGTVLTLETGAELQPLVLAGEDALVIGAPYTSAHGEPSGAVVAVAR